jgi:uncharacterized ferredoxin-like protein
MTEPIGYDDLRLETVINVAKLGAASAITAPKSGGMLFLAGKHNFIETSIISERATLHRLAEWMRARGKERREGIWFRDAEVADAIDAALIIGLVDWYPPNYDCGACGYATCAEFLHETKDLRDGSEELEFTGPTCNLRDVDLGIAVGFAVRTVTANGIDVRCQSRIVSAARKLGLIKADLGVSLSMSMTPKSVGYDRSIPTPDFESLPYEATGVLPIGEKGAGRHGGARNRQQPRNPIR